MLLGLPGQKWRKMIEEEEAKKIIYLSEQLKKFVARVFFYYALSFFLPDYHHFFPCT